MKADTRSRFVGHVSRVELTPNKHVRPIIQIEGRMATNLKTAGAFLSRRVGNSGLLGRHNSLSIFQLFDDRNHSYGVLPREFYN